MENICRLAAGLGVGAGQLMADWSGSSDVRLPGDHDLQPRDGRGRTRFGLELGAERVSTPGEN